jgi:hypothetical protein
MSTDEERELRGRLGAVLEAVAPSPAPVAATLRRARLIRARRHVAIAAGLAVAAGAAVALPVLLGPAARREPESPGKPAVTVNPAGPTARGGVIGSGTINGRRWQLVARRPGPGGAAANECFLGRGAVPANMECFGVTAPGGGSADPVGFNSVGSGRAQGLYGPVAPGVTRVTVTLAGGTVLELDPTEAYGQRYVAFAIPLPLAISRVVAYSARGEISEAVPFNTSAGDTIGAWLAPGQPGPPRATRVIGSGTVDGSRWSQSVHAGPGGYCLTGQIGGCFDTVSRSLGNRVGSITGGGRGSANWALGTAGAEVSYVRAVLSGGRSVTARALDVGGPRFFAFAIPKGFTLVSVGWYDSSGHEVASERAAQI